MTQGYEMRGGAPPPRDSGSSDATFWDSYRLMWQKSPWWVVLPALAVCYSIYSTELVPAVTPREWRVPDPSHIYTLNGVFDPGPHQWRDNYQFTALSGQKIAIRCYPGQAQNDCILGKFLNSQDRATIQYFVINSSLSRGPQNIIISAKFGNRVALDYDQRMSFLESAATYEDRQHDRFPIFSWALFVVSLLFPLSGVLIKLSIMKNK